MITYIEKRKFSPLFRMITFVIILTFSTSLIIPPQKAQAQTVLNLPIPGTMVPLSPSYNPAIIKGITVYPDNPLKFDFIIDSGDDNLKDEALKEESNKLIKYFLASLTVPEDELWVNLSPYEEKRIIANGLGATEMGIDMLAQDYILKQLTASLIYPEDELGGEFWNRVYKRAQEEYGTTEIPMNTFNKIWITPDKALVYVEGTSAFVAESHLKVMLQEDYLALQENLDNKEHGVGDIPENEALVSNGVMSEVVRNILIPEIEKEVNEGRNFAPLRQIFHSMILSTWYKKNLKASSLGKIYVDQNKTDGVDIEDKESKQKIYDRYVEAYKKGVYNYIKEDYDEATQQIIPRKYFSGGTDMEISKAYEETRSSEVSKMVRRLLLVAGVVVALVTLSPVTKDIQEINSEEIQEKTKGFLKEEFPLPYEYFKSEEGNNDSKLSSANKRVGVTGGEEEGLSVSSPVSSESNSQTSSPVTVEDRRNFLIKLSSLLAGGMLPIGVSGMNMDDGKEYWIDQAHKNPKSVFERISEYIDQPWAGDVIKMATEKDTWSALFYAQEYVNKPWAKEVIIFAMENDLWTALFYAEKYASQSWAEGVIRIASEKDFWLFLLYAEKYIDQSWAEEMLKVADKKSRSLEKESPWFTERKEDEAPWADLVYTDGYANQSSSEKIIKDASKKNYWKALKYADKYVDQPWAEDLIRTAAKMRPGLALQYSDRYAHKPWAEEIIRIAAKEAPDRAMGSVGKYINQPWAWDIIKDAAKKNLEKNPEKVIQAARNYMDHPSAENLVEVTVKENPWIGTHSAEYYIDQPWAGRFLKFSAEKKPDVALRYANKYVDHPLAEEIIKSAAEKRPDVALEYVHYYIDKPWAKNVIESAALRDPAKAVEAAKGFVSEEFLTILQNSEHHGIKGILSILEWSPSESSSERKRQARMSSLLHIIVSDNKTPQELVPVIEDNARFFNALVEIRSQPDYLGDFTIDKQLKNVSLRMVRDINDLHNESESVRFRSVNNASTEMLYSLMVYGEEEIFTSSFNGLFNRLMKRMKAENITGIQLLDQMDWQEFRVFIRLVVGFDRLDEFLATMSDDSAKILLKKFVTGIDKGWRMLEQATVIAETFGMIMNSENDQVLKILQETVKSEYERVKVGEDKESTKIYEILNGLFGKKAVINAQWLKSMAEKYKIPSIDKIDLEKLFVNEDGIQINIQRYFFSADEGKDRDGTNSFRNFLAQYKSDKNWKIEKEKNYVRIVSVSKNKRVEMYANRPTEGGVYEGIDEITEILETRNIQPQIVVHRGHSYQVERTFDHITSTAMVVALGSCGGYHNVVTVLEKALEAHIISTKGTGTMWVNDPLFKMLNNEILREQDVIQWGEFWDKVEKRLGGVEALTQYVGPHENFGALFLKAYYEGTSSSSPISVGNELHMAVMMIALSLSNVALENVQAQQVDIQDQEPKIEQFQEDKDEKGTFLSAFISQMYKETKPSPELNQALSQQVPFDLSLAAGDVEVLFFGDSHTDAIVREFVIRQLPALKAQGVTQLGMEMLESDLQPYLDRWNDSDQKKIKNQLYSGWEKRTPGNADSYMNLIKAAKNEGMRVVAIEHPNVMNLDRVEVNSHWAEIIQSNLPDGKMVALVGPGHLTKDNRAVHNILENWGITTSIIQFTGFHSEEELKNHMSVAKILDDAVSLKQGITLETRGTKLGKTEFMVPVVRKGQEFWLVNLPSSSPVNDSQKSGDEASSLINMENKETSSSFNQVTSENFPSILHETTNFLNFLENVLINIKVASRNSEIGSKDKYQDIVGEDYRGLMWSAGIASRMRTVEATIDLLKNINKALTEENVTEIIARLNHEFPEDEIGIDDEFGKESKQDIIDGFQLYGRALWLLATSYVSESNQGVSNVPLNDILRAYTLSSERIKNRTELDFEAGEIKITVTESQEVALFQIMTNLIKNALKFIDPQEGKITIRTKLSEEPGSIYIEVEDNGKGMSPEILEQIFTPSFTTGEEGGQGIGLPVVKQLIGELLNGTIEVESKAGVGTKFTIKFPIPGENVQQLVSEASSPVDKNLLKNIMSFSTEEADFLLNFGSHFENKVTEGVIKLVNAIVLESGFHVYEDLTFDEMTKEAHPYSNLVKQLEKNTKPIFFADIPVSKTLRKMPAWKIPIWKIPFLKTPFSLEIHSGYIVDILALVSYPLFPYLLVLFLKDFNLSFMSNPFVYGLATFVQWFPAVSFMAPLASHKIRNSMLNSIFAGIGSSGFRSAITAKKIIEGIVPEIRKVKNKKPTILMDFGPGHSDIKFYLKHKWARDFVVWLHGLFGHPFLDSSYVDKIGEIRFDQDKEFKEEVNVRTISQMGGNAVSSSSPINFGNGRTTEENRLYEDAIYAALDEFMMKPYVSKSLSNGILRQTKTNIIVLKERVSRIKKETQGDPVKQLERLKEEVFTDSLMKRLHLSGKDFITFSRLLLEPVASKDVLEGIENQKFQEDKMKKVKECVGSGCVVQTSVADLIIREHLGLDVKVVRGDGHVSLALVANTINDEKSFVLLLDPSEGKSSDVFSLDEYFTASGEYLNLMPKKKDEFFSKVFSPEEIPQSAYSSLRFIDGDSFYSPLHNTLGVDYAKKDQYDDAIASYQRSIELDPSSAHTYDNLGVIYIKKGQYGDAIKVYKEAIRLNPLFLEAIYNLGFAYMKNNESDKAVSTFNDAIEKGLDKKYFKEEAPWGKISDDILSQIFGLSSSPINDFQTPGGIDFNPNNLDLQVQGNEIKMEFSPDGKTLNGLPVRGFVPVIINVTPITNLPFLLGESEEESDEFSLSQLN